MVLTRSTQQHHETIVTSLQEAYLKNTLAQFVSGSKLNDLANGFISRSTMWDKLVLRSYRASAVRGLAGDKLRALIVVGGMPVLVPNRAANHTES